MSDQTPIDISLSPEMEQQIQTRSLGLIQSEFGALQTNYFMLQARIEALHVQRKTDLAIIEGLKRRTFDAENNVKILQDQWRESQTALTEANKKIATLESRRKKV